MRKAITLILLIGIIVVGCAQKGQQPTPTETKGKMPTQVTTKPPSEKELQVKLEFDKVPKEHTCDGSDISPKIEISGIKDAEVLAVIVDDPDAPGGTFTHWVMWNVEPMGVIPEGISKKPEISDPVKAIQGRNGFGKTGYNGPCPPSGTTHRYLFKVYGLDTKLDLPPGAAKSKVKDAMEGHIISYGEAMATYGR